MTKLSRFYSAGCIATGLVMLISNVAIAEPALETFSFQSGYETWQLPQQEMMGVVNAGLRKQVGEHGAIGVDFFDALHGRRGGFITLGMSAAYAYPFADSWLIDSSFFVGAGSGNGGLQLAGGGLMLRGALGMQYRLTAQDALGFGMSRVTFPEGGTIHSNQYYVSYLHDYRTIFEAGQPRFGQLPTFDLDGYAPAHHQMGLLFRSVKVPASVRRLGGGKQSGLQQIGIEWKTYLDKCYFVRAETVGAMGGNSAGYMHLMAGAGVEYPLWSRLSAEASLNLGGGGGGAVDTGGGLIYAADLGLRYRFGDAWFMRGEIGKVRAPQGQFSGTNYALSIGREFNVRSGVRDETQAGIFFTSHPVRMRVTQQTYAGNTPNWRSRPDQAVGNLGVQLDYLLSPNIFLSGQGLAAYAGGAGAYMTGLLGLGYRMPLGGSISVEAEWLAGAAGGGGLHTGSGLVSQGNIALAYQLNDSLSILAGTGQIRALNGAFKASVTSVSLVYNFNLISTEN